ncbi:aspartate aminotransferase family protein [Natrialbaceae archaeon A-CW2]
MREFTRDETTQTADDKLMPVVYGQQNLVIDKAEDTRIWDVNGNEYLDAVAGIAVVNTGHSHPTVVEALQDQAEKFVQSSYYFYHEPMSNLLETLAEKSPGELNNTFFGNSGAEAVEGAIKLAKKATGSSELISLRGSFHGRTPGAMALTGQSKYTHTFHPHMPGAYQIPSPNYYRYGDRFESEEEFGKWAAEQIYEVIKYDSNDDIAAVFVEPIQGEGGIIVPPENYLPYVKEICEKEDLLFVADEVQTGMGRTGELFAVDHWDVEPDIMTLAKGIGSGMPFGLFMGTEEVSETMDPGDHYTTYGGHPMACAAANATFEVIEDESLVENAATVGEKALDRLAEMKEDYDLIGDVRGKGLHIGVELVKDRSTREAADEAAGDVRAEAYNKGLLVSQCGTHKNVIRLTPPLTVSSEDMSTMLDRLEAAIRTVSNDMKIEAR